MSKLLYTMFISNNCPSLHLWWKQNLVKQQKVSKYYEPDCLQNVLFFFMILLTTDSVKNTHISARNFFIFLKTALNQIWNAFKFVK